MLRLLCISSILTSAIAQAMPVDKTEFCREISAAKAESRSQIPDLRRAQLELLLQKLFPARSFELRGPSAPRPRRLPSTGRRMIVALGIEHQDSEARARYEELQRAYRRQAGEVISIFRQPSEARCLRRMEQLNFDPQRFLELRAEIGRMEDQKRHAEHVAVLAAHARLPKALRENWELQTGLHVAELKLLIESREVDHLIVVGHANSHGHLSDAHGNFLPQGFFHGVRGKLRSLSLFSCHGEKVVKFLGVEQLDSPAVFYPASRSPLPVETTQLSALPAFVRRVEKSLPREQVLPAPAPQLCEVQINAGALLRGEAALLLGDKYFLGFVTPNKLQTFRFDCGLLRAQELLGLRSLKARGDLDLAAPWELRISTPEGVSAPLAREDFSSNGTYEGSLFFSLLP